MVLCVVKVNAQVQANGMNLPLILSAFEYKLPGNTSLPSLNEELNQLKAFDKGNYKYSISDYFSKPKASSFQLSPNGKYLSYREKDENSKNHIYVKEIATNKIKRAIEEKEELVSDFGWINDERLYYSMDKGGNENYHIYAVNLDGSNLIDLTPFDNIKAGILKILKDQKDYIIVSMNKNNKQIFDPYKLNVVTD
jgi:Tol biopolymer transport system component